ncbi:MAG: ATP-binding cassette domain-containing protein [Granulosicoccus sp.]|nr:ATP-binding cassette domain-containing protein [Granulosicoccus sp.]
MTDSFREKLYPVNQSVSVANNAANDKYVSSNEATIALEIQDLTKHFKVRLGRNPLSLKSATVKAVDGLSFTLHAGQTLGLVGESGCGKTTVGRSILRLIDPTSGDVHFHGENIARCDKKSLEAMRRRMQVIFQDPFASLNPRMTVGQIIAEPLQVYKLVDSKLAARKRVAELLSNVGLISGTAERYPHQLSGGQRQRVGIARSLAMEPSTIICDEPVSALDVSVQAQIMNLLEELQQEFGLSYVFIAHDLAVVRHISHRVVVMYLGKVMEMADCDDLYSKPLHPYTKALMDAAPIPDASSERVTERRMLKGEIPSPLSPPPGCVFSSRCPHAIEACKTQSPPLKEYRPGQYAACIRIEETH